MFYCDVLTPAAARAVILWGAETAERDVVALERIGMTPQARRAQSMLKQAGFRVREADFFAGYLRDAAGESVYLVARKAASHLAFEVAEDLVARTAELRSLNERFGRNTILLHLAKTIAFPIEKTLARLLVARELARLAGRDAMVVAERPQDFDTDKVVAVARVSARFYPVRSVAPTLRFIGHVVARETARGLKLRVTRSGVIASTAGPTVLTIQEDDLGTDRSYRLQPHWLEGEPAFDTLVLERQAGNRLPYDAAGLRQLRVAVVPRAMLARRAGTGKADQDIVSASRGMLARAATKRDAVSARALTRVWTLLRRAGELAHLCRRFNVAVFVIAEPYAIETDAMQLVAPALNVRTVVYQYSNLQSAHPVMFSTADTMAVFSRRYEPLWSNRLCAPGRFVEFGYTYDSSFALLKERAASARRRMEEAGARFVLCYFDESIQRDRWGLIHEDDHKEDLRRLMRMVAADPELGLVVKSQFERNSPSVLLAGDATYENAAASGRYLELRHGAHRNIILPAEAAMVADLAIAHAVGSTAALEAALAGCRSILLNPYGLKNPQGEPPAHCMFDHLDGALDAISAHRARDPQFANLGDWTAVLHEFDPYRDGRAAHRLYNVIESELKTAQQAKRSPATTRTPAMGDHQ